MVPPPLASGLTDTQLSDNHFYLLFPNFFATIRAGEATVIISTICGIRSSSVFNRMIIMGDTGNCP